MEGKDNKSRKHVKNTKTVDRNESVPIDTTEKNEPKMPTLSHTGNLNKKGDARKDLGNSLLLRLAVKLSS